MDFISADFSFMNEYLNNPSGQEATPNIKKLLLPHFNSNK